ncbi:hypothetical protein HOLleu_01050 [Holothuria leucospilota]|uniref:Uncharacterized protein n=1 Tax=Holothuria leucospilota TaxID=206669 RepID=A0A9Q1CPF9_HOLLE|nr:hypothetical protein HOLleu_01050 [Holothuria leucospilota]
MLKTTTRAEKQMPPNHHSLVKHIKRANFQGRIYKKSLQQCQDLPSPVGSGWKIENGTLIIDWMDLPPAPTVFWN